MCGRKLTMHIRMSPALTEWHKSKTPDWNIIEKLNPDVQIIWSFLNPIWLSLTWFVTWITFLPLHKYALLVGHTKYHIKYTEVCGCHLTKLGKDSIGVHTFAEYSFLGGVCRKNSNSSKNFKVMEQNTSSHFLLFCLVNFEAKYVHLPCRVSVNWVQLEVMITA